MALPENQAANRDNKHQPIVSEETGLLDSLHSKEQHGNSNLRPQRTQRPVHPSGAVVLPDRLARDVVLDCGSLGAEPDHHRHAVGAVDAQPRAAGADAAAAARIHGGPGARRPDRRVALPGQAAGFLPDPADLLPVDRLVVQPDLVVTGVAVVRQHHRPAFRRLDVQQTTRHDDVDETVIDGQVLWALQ